MSRAHPHLLLRRVVAGALGAMIVTAGLAVTAPAASAEENVWDRVARCESGGNWGINTGNGHYGGLQFTAGTWRAFGGEQYAPYAHQALKIEQIQTAQKVLERQGPGAWPHCSKVAGLARANGAVPYPGSAPTPAVPGPFTDVRDDHLFADEIAWAKRTGITTGYADGTFRPADDVDRDAMVAFLFRVAGSPSYTPPTSSPFSDVRPGHPFYREVMWAYEQGITTGWADGTFRPTAKIDRDAMAAFLYRFQGEPAFTAPSRSPFRDVPRSHLFYREIAWMKASGTSTGWADGTYRPTTNIDRDATVAFLHRIAR